jgi:hypothetical protein
MLRWRGGSCRFRGRTERCSPVPSFQSAHKKGRPKAPLFFVRKARSALAELEAAAGLGLAVLLAFHGARVTRQEPSDLQDAAQFRLVILQGPADAMANSAGLTGQSATGDGAEHVKLVVAIGYQERLGQQHAQDRACEILDDLLAVDDDLALARLDPDARGGFLAATGGVGTAELVAFRIAVRLGRAVSASFRSARVPV